VFSPQIDDPLTAVLRPGQAFADLCLGDWSDGAAKPRQGTCCMILRIHRKRVRLPLSGTHPLAPNKGGSPLHPQQEPPSLLPRGYHLNSTHNQPLISQPPSPLAQTINMSSSESSTPNHTPQPRMVVQNLYIPDAAADEIDLANQPWMMATVIDDDDLMFGGKPLCAWYEEDRRMLSSAMDDEEPRGRPRERSRGDSHHHHQQSHQQPQHQHQLQHQHRRHHSKKSSAEPKQ
jgi:hypothetical protein